MLVFVGGDWLIDDTDRRKNDWFDCLLKIAEHNGIMGFEFVSVLSLSDNSSTPFGFCESCFSVSFVYGHKVRDQIR